jgi:hypothetical protein
MRFENDIQKEIYYTSQIDYCYWAIKKISENSDEPKHPLYSMIDEATGFNKANIENQIDEIIYLIKTIIRCKEKCPNKYDTNLDKEFLKKLNKIKLSNKENANSQ